MVRLYSFIKRRIRSLLRKTSKSLRRIAQDHASLHNKGLPPNHLFSPSHDESNLTSLSVLLAGPEGTPYSSGLFQLELSIPNTYPQAPPTAHFRTKIFHPNVDPATGAICVETLKRDWKPELTLRDILITISCLLIYPNPSSALNAEAGMMIEEDYKSFEKRAMLFTNMHAAIPAEMIGKVDEARNRGEVDTKDQKALPKGKGKRPVGTEETSKASGDSENGQSQWRQSTLAAPKKDSRLDSPDPFLSNTSQKPLGLGLSTSMQSIHTATDMDIDSTPIQPPPPRRTRKRYALNVPPDVPPTSSASFSQQPTTPTPAAPPARDNAEGPVTPRPPDAKRLRISPPTPVLRRERVLSSPIVNAEQNNGECDHTSSEIYPWITWYRNLPSPPESRAEKLAREEAERRRMAAAGGDIRKWNSGAFGVRKGIRRL
jgi:ubiquitin-conjugating enzyme E2 S